MSESICIGTCCACGKGIMGLGAIEVWYGETDPGALYHLSCAPVDATLRFVKGVQSASSVDSYSSPPSLTPKD
jgi:hypothetical protein